MNKSTWMVITLLSSVTGFATVKPAPVFTESAVLQQGQPVRIWGTAAPGEKVKVSFASQIREAVTDEAGAWLVTLGEMPVCAEGRSLIFHGSETAQPIELKDVLVGEVWLAGGQSNMQTPMKDYRKTTQADIDRANDPLLRMLRIPAKFHEGYKEKKHFPWEASNPQTVPEFYASAYYFAKNLRETLDVPVGIICCAVGGTRAETWMSRQTLAKNPDFRRILEGYERNYRNHFTNEAAYLEHVGEFKQAMNIWAKNREAKITPNPRPVKKMGPYNRNRPAGLHENMLTQVIPSTVRGVIWYQGESNVKNGFHYRFIFQALIAEWREEFQNPELPFLFAQLATYGSATSQDTSWPELRESQRWTEEHVENTGMIVLVDAGDQKNIHPSDKKTVGDRFALLARHKVYGEKDLICRGPRLVNLQRRPGAIELTFKDVGTGLMLKSDAAGAFEVCGTDGKYIPATAALKNGVLIISSVNVENPQHVRYGWKKWFAPTLFNAEGLPSSPFRTDDFPMVTQDRYYLDR